ncbi:MAG TPA: ABC transporter substrate-binding protein [Acidimicrobiales bacterium]
MPDEHGISRRTFIAKGAAAGGAVVLAGAAGSALAACGSSSSTGSSSTSASGGKPGVGSGTPVSGGSLTVGMIAEIDGLYSPANHWDTSGYIYAFCLYDTLMAVAADGTIQPNLAQSCTPNATFDTWTLTLRPDVKFSDGSDLTSAVVASNFAALKASLLTGQALTQVASCTVTGPMTVEYKLTAPNPTFTAGLTTQVGFVFGQAMIDEVKGGNANPTPVGTGPFVYKEWQPNNHFTATKNPNYWRKGLPYLDQITLRPIPDTVQREATLKTGGVDMIVSADPNTIKRFDGQSNYQLVDSRTGVIGEPTMAYIQLNCVVAPTNDLTIRQALAKSLDQATIQKVFGAGYTQPIHGLFLPDSPYYSTTSFPSYDPAGAKKLVSQYKALHGTPTIQLLTINDPRLAQVVQIIQQMWNQVGFDVTIAQVEQASLVSDFIAGKFQAATSAQFGAVNPDLNYVWWSTTTVAPVGSIGLNFARNSNPVIEQNMLTGRHTADQATRVKAYQTVNEQLSKDLPYVWLQQYLYAAVASSRVQNFANPTLPDGKPGYAFDEGIFSPTAIWLSK